MADIRSPISCEIDFEADGKQTGYLRLPHSVHRSAYGWIPIPIAQIKHGQGPTLLLMAGNHGDEYEGQVALTRLIQQLEPDMIRGRIILVPMANYPAAEVGMRTSPIDGGNLNRSFPGDASGSITQVIAHYIEHVLMKMADFAIDLHSGGSSLHYLPTVLYGNRPDRQEATTIVQMMQAFGAPYACRFRGASPVATSGAAKRQSTNFILVEMGGSGTVSPETLRITHEGVTRVMAQFGFLENHDVPAPPPTRTLTITPDCYLYARAAGVFEPLVELGQDVVAGQPAGFIHTPQTPWEPSTPVSFETPGVVICKRVPGLAQRGDCLFHVGQDVEV